MKERDWGEEKTSELVGEKAVQESVLTCVSMCIPLGVGVTAISEPDVCVFTLHYTPNYFIQKNLSFL